VAAEEAGETIATGLAQTPADHPYRAPMLTVAAGAAHVRYELTGSSDDLDAAIDGGQRVLDMLPADHPHNVRVQLNLAGALADRYRQTGRAADRAEALHLWREATTIGTAPSGMRLTAARQLVDFAARQLVDFAAPSATGVSPVTVPSVLCSCCRTSRGAGWAGRAGKSA